MDFQNLNARSKSALPNKNLVKGSRIINLDNKIQKSPPKSTLTLKPKCKYEVKSYSEFMLKRDNNSSIKPQNVDETDLYIKASNPMKSSLQNFNNKKGHNESVKNHLKRIFEYYCQYGERMNVKLLKSNKYQKMAVDADILDSKVTKTRLELIFASENKLRIKATMDFTTFMNSLIKLAEVKFSDKNETNKSQNMQTSALQTLLNNHLWPLYERIFDCPVILNENDVNNATRKDSLLNLSNTNFNASTTFNKRMSASSLNILTNLTNIEEMMDNPQLQEILKSAAPVMYDIYKVYFPWELSMSEDENFLKENSTKAYFVFLKDFDLFPSLISKPAAFQLLQLELIKTKSEITEFMLDILKNIEINPLGRSNNKNILGKCLTFVKFLNLICKIADLSQDKPELNNLANSNLNSSQFGNIFTLPEKIILTFERMQLSNGFQTIEQKTHKTHNRKTSSILSGKILEKVKGGMNDRLNEQDNNNFSCSEMADADDVEVAQHNHRLRKLKKYDLGNLKDIFEYTDYILENFGNQLNAIFKYYCSFGDPFNSDALKTNKFYKFIKEAGLIRQNNVSDLSSSQILNSSSYSVNFNKLNSNFGIKTNDIDLIFFKIADVSNKEPKNISKFSRRDSNKSLNSSMDFSQINSALNLSPDSNKKRPSMVNSYAKLDFIGFIKALEIVSLLLSPNTYEKDAIDQLIKENVFPLLEKIDNKNIQTFEQVNEEKKSNREFTEVLKILFKAITPIYRFYQNRVGHLNQDTFFKFCTDFSIFPGLISKPKLNLFFKTTNNKDNIQYKAGENEFIDQKTLVLILAQCAFEMSNRTPELNTVEKILLFVEKLSLSEGTIILIKEYGQSRIKLGESLDILALFRNHFPDYFLLPEVKKLGFFDVLNHEGKI